MISRSKKQQARAQLDAALAGVPAESCTSDVQAMVTLARLLAPRPHPNPTYQSAERAAFLMEAVVAGAGGVDLDAITSMDGVAAIHVREVALASGAVVRVADLEPVDTDDATVIAVALEAEHGSPVRR